ncbi:EscU/YscU/HrcU family type III secretion system export apparatus switch protein [Ramlibacter sp. AW1]|uniref:EscU/YscU/HrcU family type III secretion system export apparatus switch protein n=1 Tax=Ramlibacter aurantiacus TaxID=2801330 RepID=A0A936ZJP0_9BURK|nr:EscU/YscU/HrcU family type III secretion system export apparatus switch protein [Ramlibacter aurantiacus]MBL0421438.1 EscU/YscU/HrcU family type III secretion system export apparatus switch protein [Ramlibacter aurantiacus]
MSASETSREDRELPATERRLEKAREQGQVPRSRDLAHLASIGLLLALLAGLGPWIGGQALRLVGGALRFDRDAAFATADLTHRLGSTGVDALLWLAPLLLLFALALGAAGIALGGWNVSTEALAPRLDRLDPVAGLRRLVQPQQMLTQLRLALLVAALLGAAAWFLWRHAQGLDLLARMSLGAAVASGFDWLAGGLAVLAGTCLVAALIDVPMQLLRHRSDLRMTREEVRREHKESDGDPHLKGERRRRQRELSRGRMLAAVPAADVVVTNPTHYAVALRYDPATMGAPRVVALGADHLALKIRQVAAAAGVPVLEAPPLARALWRHGSLDAEIPAPLYGAVAQVLAWVMRLRTSVRPPPAPVFELPPGLDPLESTE